MGELSQPLATSDERKMHRIERLNRFMDAYGTAVRAGVITPNLDDETAIRRMMRLPVPNEDVKRYWKATKGVRKPVTLSYGDQKPQNAQADETPEGDEKADEEEKQ
jgi:hypothetical protein